MTTLIGLQGARFEVDLEEKVLYFVASDSAPHSHPNPAEFNPTWNIRIELPYVYATIFNTSSQDEISAAAAIQLNENSATGA